MRALPRFPSFLLRSLLARLVNDSPLMILLMLHVAARGLVYMCGKGCFMSFVNYFLDRAVREDAVNINTAVFYTRINAVSLYD